MRRIDIPLGIGIWMAAEFAIKAAKEVGEDVEFKFNDFTLAVSPLSFGVDIVKIYWLMCDISQLQQELRKSHERA